MREHVCRSADVLDYGLQIGGLSGEVIEAVRSIAAPTATATVVGNYAVVAAELAGDTVKKDAIDAGSVHAYQSRRIGRHVRAGILATGNRGARILNRKIHVAPHRLVPC